MPGKQYPTRWTEKDFDTLCWHDNPIRGMRLRNPRPEDDEHQYDYDLILDIVHILEWITTAGGRAFILPTAPARLTFHGVDKLSINIHLVYKQDLEIDWIEREDISTEEDGRVGTVRLLYTIHVIDTFRSGTESSISFEASGFTQELTGEVVVEGDVEANP